MDIENVELPTPAVVSVDNDIIDHALTLRFQSHAVGKTTVHTIAIPARLVAKFVAEVAQHGANALVDIAREWALGDCGTCGNRRLVTVRRPNGHVTEDYCPACNPEAVRALIDFPRLRDPDPAES